MTAQRCSRCRAEVAANAPVCRQCGFPLGRGPASRAERRRRGWGWSDARIALVVVAVLIAWFMMRSSEPRSATNAGGSASASAPAPKLDAGSRALLSQVYGGIQGYRRQHGKYPATPAEVNAMASPSPSAAYALRVRSADEYGVCVQALAANASGPARLSMDQDGYVYGGAGCSGETIYQFGK